MPGWVGSCRVGRSPIRFFDLTLNNALALRASQNFDLLVVLVLMVWSSRKRKAGSAGKKSFEEHHVFGW